MRIDTSAFFAKFTRNLNDHRDIPAPGGGGTGGQGNGPGASASYPSTPASALTSGLATPPSELAAGNPTAPQTADPAPLSTSTSDISASASAIPPHLQQQTPSSPLTPSTPTQLPPCPDCHGAGYKADNSPCFACPGPSLSLVKPARKSNVFVTTAHLDPEAPTYSLSSPITPVAGGGAQVRPILNQEIVRRLWKKPQAQAQASATSATAAGMAEEFMAAVSDPEAVHGVPTPIPTAAVAAVSARHSSFPPAGSSPLTSILDDLYGHHRRLLEEELDLDHDGDVEEIHGDTDSDSDDDDDDDLADGSGSGVTGSGGDFLRMPSRRRNRVGSKVGAVARGKNARRSGRLSGSVSLSQIMPAAAAAAAAGAAANAQPSRRRRPRRGSSASELSHAAARLSMDSGFGPASATLSSSLALQSSSFSSSAGMSMPVAGPSTTAAALLMEDAVDVGSSSSSAAPVHSRRAGSVPRSGSIRAGTPVNSKEGWESGGSAGGGSGGGRRRPTRKGKGNHHSHVHEGHIVES